MPAKRISCLLMAGRVKLIDERDTGTWIVHRCPCLLH